MNFSLWSSVSSWCHNSLPTIRLLCYNPKCTWWALGQGRRALHVTSHTVSKQRLLKASEQCKCNIVSLSRTSVTRQEREKKHKHEENPLSPRRKPLGLHPPTRLGSWQDGYLHLWFHDGLPFALLWLEPIGFHVVCFPLHSILESLPPLAGSHLSLGSGGMQAMTASFLRWSGLDLCSSRRSVLEKASCPARWTSGSIWRDVRWASVLSVNGAIPVFVTVVGMTCQLVRMVHWRLPVLPCWVQSLVLLLVPWNGLHLSWDCMDLEL